MLNLFIFTIYSLLAAVLVLDLRRHWKLHKAEKRIALAEKKFIEAIEDHLERVAKDSMDECENGTCGHEDANIEVITKEFKSDEEAAEFAKKNNLVEVSLVKVPKEAARLLKVKSAPAPKKKGDFSKKLTLEQIKEIGKAPFSITHRALAVKYGVSEGRIGQIRRGAKTSKKK